MSAVTIAYKPLGLGLSIAGGMVAGMAFKQVWKAVAHEDDAPDAKDENRVWKEILLAAAVRGAVAAVVKAAIDRAGATATRRLTGTWPG